ncbi:hypothetical protein [Aliihoeflea aestuarii]|uniref:hypothetical protein n=1 Tax=Aliihoeflea aestuarii TaxID=453840 RepID=UPI00355688C7
MEAKFGDMNDETRQNPPGREAERQAQRRKARLAERLRANLQRRKVQSRARRAGDEDQRPEGLLKNDPSTCDDA